MIPLGASVLRPPSAGLSTPGVIEFGVLLQFELEPPGCVSPIGTVGFKHLGAAAYFLGAIG